MPKKTQYHTVTEAAEMLGVSVQAIHKWIREGQMQTAGRFGIAPKSPYRITRDEIERARQIMSGN